MKITQPSELALRTTLGLAVLTAGLVFLSERSQAQDRPAPTGSPMQLVAGDPLGIKSWRERLTDLNIDARERAFDELVPFAAQAEDMHLVLQAWSLDSSEPELAWTARLALREVGKLRQRPTPQRVFWTIPDQMIRGGSTDSGRAAIGNSPGAAPSPLEASLSLRQFHTNTNAPLDGGRRVGLGFPRVFKLALEPVESPRRRMPFMLDVRPEGVALMILENEGGLISNRKYFARSLGALLESQPALLKQVPELAGLLSQTSAPDSSFQCGSENQILRQDGALGALVKAGMQRKSASPGFIISTKVLGVKCTPLSSQEGENSFLGPGVGLRIEQRIPGTVAGELDLRRGDILIEVCGRPVCSLPEITRILEEREGEEITVKILDRNGLERNRAWSPTVGGAQACEVECEVRVEAGSAPSSSSKDE